MSNLRSLTFDAIIIGGGGSGLRAALELAKSGKKTAVLSKVFPTRSHTVSAQGGITCAIASADPNDDWRWHMYDTVKGGDYIADQDAAEYMCSEGPKAVFELERVSTMAASISVRSVVSPRTLVKVVRPHVPAPPPTVPVTRCCTPFTRTT